jgi:hypothetical protein
MYNLRGHIANMGYHIFSQFTHQIDWIQDINSCPQLDCGLIDCFCNKTPEFESESESELGDEFFNEEIATIYLKNLAQVFDISPYSSQATCDIFWSACSAFTTEISTLEWAASTYKCLLDSRVTPDGFSTLLVCVADEKWNVVKAFAKNGADIHYMGNDTDHSPVEETATSLSLYSSRRFFEWRRILRDLKMDITNFIESELQRSRLGQDGWSAETLGDLFEFEFEAVDWDQKCGCLHSYDNDDSDEGDCVIESDCYEKCNKAAGVMVEVSWQTLLERVKHGESLVGYIEKYATLPDSESDSQESNDFDRDTTETSENKSSDNEERDEIYCHETENDASSWLDESNYGGSDHEEKGDEEEEGEGKEAPGWFCVLCWHKDCLNFSNSPSVASISEAELDEEESLMLLKIDI